MSTKVVGASFGYGAKRNMIGQALSAIITELEQPHRFHWRVDVLPDGWQAHLNHAHESKGDLAADAIETAVAHMVRKGMNDAEARKAITVNRLKKEEPAKAPPVVTK